MVCEKAGMDNNIANERAMSLFMSVSIVQVLDNEPECDEWQRVVNLFYVEKFLVANIS
jgi:hypothetical protein